MRCAGCLTVFFLVTVICGGTSVLDGEPAASLNERLGYPPDAKLLIVHNDDAGVAHSVNTAAFKALESGLVTSTSLMAPCPWIHEVAAYAKKNPQADIGVHLTLTCEWDNYRWKPVAGKSRVPSLMDPEGYFNKIQNAMAVIDAGQAEIEMRQQVELARAVGIEPTHIDSHQLIVLFRPDLFEAYLQLGRETGIPVLLSPGLFEFGRAHLGEAAPDWESFLKPEDILIDNVVSITPWDAAEGWPAFYQKTIKNLKPGVTELIVHVGIDGDEMMGIAGDVDFGSSWRQKELDYITSDEFRELLKEENVKLIGWKEIAELYRSGLNSR